MNVGEETGHWALVISMGRSALLRLSTVGDYRGRMRVWLFACCTMRNRPAFLVSDMNELGEQHRQRGLYLFAGPVGSGKTTLMHELAKSLFKGQQAMSIEDPVEIAKGRHAPVAVE